MEEVLIPNAGNKNGRHLKIKVEVNISQPLLRGTIVKMKNISRWVDFKYDDVQTSAMGVVLLPIVSGIAIIKMTQ